MNSIRKWREVGMELEEGSEIGDGLKESKE
jgi:hypothetical protein